MPGRHSLVVTANAVTEEQVNDNDRIAGYQLLQSGVAVLFRAREEQIQTGPDEAEFQVRLELEFEPDDENSDAADIIRPNGTVTLITLGTRQGSTALAGPNTGRAALSIVGGGPGGAGGAPEAGRQKA